MTARKRCLWSCVLCLHLAGCSGGYRLVTALPGDPEGPRPGDELRLTLQDGVVVKGSYAGIDGGDVLLAEARIAGSPADTFSELPTVAPANGKPVRYPLAQIAGIEKQRVDYTGPLIATVVIVGMVVMVSQADNVLDDFGEN